MGDSIVSNSKVVVAVAPVCHTNKKVPESSRNPLSAQEVADEAVRCWRAGAAMVHLHVRDEHGEQVSDLSTFRATLDLIRDQSDIIIQGSTGGVSELTLEERCVCLNEPRVEMASLNMGSVNFGTSVYINTIEDIVYWAKRIRDSGTSAELEVFNPSMIESAFELRDQGILSDPLHFNFALGFPSSLSATPSNLHYLTSMLEPGQHWGLVHEGMTNFTVLTAAIGMGATVVRAGFEDGAMLRDGEPARSNADLIERLVSIVRLSGREVATPAEARTLLSLKGME